MDTDCDVEGDTGADEDNDDKKVTLMIAYQNG